MSGRLAIVAAFVLWSTTAVFVRASGLPFANFVVLANFFGIALLLCSVPRILDRLRALPFASIVALSFFSAANVWSSLACFRLTSIGNYMIPHYAAPVLVAVFAPLVLGEKPSPRVWEALAISLAGLVAVGWQGLRLGTAADVKGLALAFLSAIAYAVCILLSRKLRRDGADPYAVTIGGALVLPLAVLPLVDWSAFAWRPVAIAFGAGACHLSAASSLYLLGLSAVPAATAGIIGYFEVLFGILWGRVIYAEPVTASTLAGAACIAIAGWLVLYERQLDDGEKNFLKTAVLESIEKP